MTRTVPRLRQADRAVSPVIGVVLMVAVTVLLATVVGTIVLDIGQATTTIPPQPSLEIKANAASQSITISHQGGAALPADRTRLLVEYENGSSVTFEPLGRPTTLAAGAEAVLQVDGNGTAETIDWDGDGTVEGGSYTSDGLPPFAAGTEISVTIVDVQSQREVFEATVTA